MSARPSLTRVLVHDFRVNGALSKHVRVWAAFMLYTEACIYADKLQKDNPTWLVTVSR